DNAEHCQQGRKMETETGVKSRGASRQTLIKRCGWQLWQRSHRRSHKQTLIKHGQDWQTLQGNKRSIHHRWNFHHFVMRDVINKAFQNDIQSPKTSTVYMCHDVEVKSSTNQLFLCLSGFTPISEDVC
ncbi:MAG: hypothetical protein ACKPKO_04850, partial [Candidatus Fonsibacter sp.]